MSLPRFLQLIVGRPATHKLHVRHVLIHEGPKTGALVLLVHIKDHILIASLLQPPMATLNRAV